MTASINRFIARARAARPKGFPYRLGFTFGAWTAHAVFAVRRLIGRPW